MKGALAIALGMWSFVAAASCTSPTLTPPTQWPTSGPYFAMVPNAFPDLNPYVKSFGREVATLQDVIVVDLNCDGRPDVLMHMYSNQDLAQRSIETNAAVPNVLVAFIQQPDGTFVDQSQALFGTSALDLGGLSSTTGVIVPNFTGDGYPAVAFQMTREDGRKGDTPASAATNYARTAILVSNGNGTYQLQQPGAPGWHANIAVAPVRNANPDIVLFASNGVTEGWRWQNGQVQAAPGYPDLLGGSFVFLPSTDASPIASQVAVPIWTNVNGQPVQLLGLKTRSAGGQWSTASIANPFSATYSVPFISWQGNQSMNNVLNYKGVNYAYADFEAVCMLHRTPSAKPTVVFRWNAFQLPSSYVIGQTVDLRSADLLQRNIMLGFDIDGQTLTYRDLNISAEETLIADNEIQCGDFNGDGYDDIIVRTIASSDYHSPDGRPRIYLNDGQGNFSAANTSVLPALPATMPSGSCQAVKVANSGLYDFICWSYNWSDFNNPNRPVLFKAQRPLPLASAAPASVQAYPGDGYAVVAFDRHPAGAQDAVKQYTATSLDGSASATGTAPVVVGGLANGKTYQFTLAEVRTGELGPKSLPSNPVAPGAAQALVTPVTADCLFNWAEITYPTLFGPQGTVSFTDSIYYYRFYTTTNDYLAVSFADSHVWVLGGPFGLNVRDVGAANDFLAVSGCH